MARNVPFAMQYVIGTQRYRWVVHDLVEQAGEGTRGVGALPASERRIDLSLSRNARNAISAPTALTPAVVEVPAVRGSVPRVKVKVTDDAVMGTNIVSSHPPGTLEAVMCHLPSERQRKRVMSNIQYYGNDLRSTINMLRGIIDQTTWAHAIAAEIIGRLSPQPEASVELSCIAQGGYLALNDGVYRLSPVEAAPLTKAMAVIRRRSLEAAKGEADAILGTAKKQAETVVEKAALKMQEANLKLAKVNAEVAAMPPAWAIANRHIIKKAPGCWCIGFNIGIGLRRFEHTFRRDPLNSNLMRKRWWTAKQVPHTVMLLWVPLGDGGTYNQRAIFCERDYGMLPHISNDGSCMTLASAPERLTTGAHAAILREIIQNCMAVVNLSSLYARYAYWPASIQASVPDAIKPMVEAAAWHLLEQPDFACNGQEDTTLEQERDTTFTARRATNG